MLTVHTQILGSIMNLCLQGRLVASETDNMRGVVYSLPKAKALVLNLDQLIAIDAAGLGLLLELREWSSRKGIDFSLMNVTERVNELLEITHLNSVFKISSEAEVLLQARSGLSDHNIAMPHCDELKVNQAGMRGITNEAARFA